MVALAGVLQGYSGWWIASYFPQVWQPDYDWKFFTADVAVTLASLITIAPTFLAIRPKRIYHESLWEHRCRSRKAWKILNAPLPGLSDTATIVKSFAELLPAIRKILGLM